MHTSYHFLLGYRMEQCQAVSVLEGHEHEWFPQGHFPLGLSEAGVIFTLPSGNQHKKQNKTKKTSHQELNFPPHSIKALQRLGEGNVNVKEREKYSKCVHKIKVELDQYMDTEGSCLLTTLCLFEACSKLKRRIKHC